MAKLSIDETKKTALLSKLQLTDDEVEKFSRQLSEVLKYMEELNEVDTNGVEPTAQTDNLQNKLRADEIHTENCLSQEDALSGTENTINGFFVVPQILKKNV